MTFDGIEESITLQCGEKRSIGQISVMKFSDGQRIARAFGLGFLMLIVTALITLIPIVHIIMLIGGLITTAAVFFSALGRRQAITAGSGSCPACSKPFRIMPRKYAFPFQDVCEACGRAVYVTK